jgi:hypothetical protein
MTREEEHHAELVAQHAERVAVRVEGKGLKEGAACLRMLAASLRLGAHLRPAGSQAEAEARAAAVVEGLLRSHEKAQGG